MSSYVDGLVSSHKVVVFSKTYCPYCVKAKKVLKKYSINDLIVVELENRDDMDEIQDYLAKLTGARSVIIYFIGKIHNQAPTICVGPAS
jgi:glutaredoxin 3